MARRFSLNPRRVALSGYSMGGYGTYKLGIAVARPVRPRLHHRRAHPVAARGCRPTRPPQGQSTNSNLVLENARWVPFLNWAGTVDESVPYVGAPRAAGALRRAGAAQPAVELRRRPLHARGDRRVGGRARLPRARARQARPAAGGLRVHARRRPAARSGWCTTTPTGSRALRVRDRSGDPRTDPARGEVSARSRAFGVGAPVTRQVSLPLQGDPLPTAIEGTEWARLPRRRKANALALRLENVRSLRVDGRRARLRGRPLPEGLDRQRRSRAGPAVPAAASRRPGRGRGTSCGPGQRAAGRGRVPARRDPAGDRRPPQLRDLLDRQSFTDDRRPPTGRARPIANADRRRCRTGSR